jgi:NAD(P)-dependent dehydrogenase (short-subunit alcohol dehydrogenase family)
MQRLDGQIGIVTGSGRDIGEAVARRLASEGATVVLADIADASRVAESIEAGGGRAIALTFDLAAEDSIAGLIGAVADRFGRIDFLHNNAAATSREQMAQDMALIDMSAEVWDRAFTVTTRGTMLMMKHALPLMLANGGGSIVNTSSGAALRGDLYAPAYAASKAAINCLTLYAATQYGKQGIRCNVVSPGMILTEGAQQTVPQAQLARIEKHKLTPHLGEPRDIAAAVAWLVSDDARYVTGQIIQVDGGITAHMPFFAENIEAFLSDPNARRA